MPDDRTPPSHIHEVSPTSLPPNNELANSYGPESTAYLFNQHGAAPEVIQSPSPLYVVPGPETPAYMEPEKGVFAAGGRKILGMPAKIFYVLSAVVIAVVVGVAVGVGVGVGTQRAASARSPQTTSLSGFNPDASPAPAPSAVPGSGGSNGSNKPNDDDYDGNNNDDEDEADESNKPDESENPTPTKAAPKSTSTTTSPRPENTFVTSGTTGESHNSCQSSDPGTYEAADGTRFQQYCHTDWPSTFPAVGGGETSDVLVLTVYTFEDCMDRCAAYNRVLQEGETRCAGVTYNSNLTVNVKHHGGNCWLKDKQGENQTKNKETSSSAAII